MSTRQRLIAPFASVATVMIAGCGPDGAGLDAEQTPVIIGTVDWQDVTTLEAGVVRDRSYAVGYLSIPARGTRCTAFLIAPDVVMTNHHCIPDERAAAGATFDPTRETGVSYRDRVRFSCGTRIGGDSSLDYALLRCSGAPGDTYGVLDLSSRQARRGDRIYVVQQNCDYHRNRSCTPNKKVASGAIEAVGSRLSHNADTLGGSSGSPVLHAETHVVIGLHNAGVGGNYEGRGTKNRAVPMSRIVPELSARFPQIVLGGAEPARPGPGAGQDSLEPNDTMGRATLVTTDATWRDLSLHAGDQDVFEVVLMQRGAVAIHVAFSHALGDVDAELRQDGLTGSIVANATSGSDDEQLEAAGLEPGVYYLRIYGYRGATNRYALSVQIEADPDRTPPPDEPEPTPPTGELFEPNDDRDAAPVVALPFDLQSGLRIADGLDVDYFAFDSDGAPRTITLSFEHDDGDLDLVIEDQSGRTVANRAGVENVEQVTGPLPAGRLFVKVIGYASATGAYALSIR